MLDATDYEILNLLKQNARLGWREIGEIVHLTGQAVGNRVARLEKLGVVKGYTITTDAALMGLPLRASIHMFMNSANHPAFLAFVRENPNIIRADRISGEGCYLLVALLPNDTALNQLLDTLLTYGNYKVNLSIGVVKA